jgi:hypothetical protein
MADKYRCGCNALGQPGLYWGVGLGLHRWEEGVPQRPMHRLYLPTATTAAAITNQPLSLGLSKLLKLVAEHM